MMGLPTERSLLAPVWQPNLPARIRMEAGQRARAFAAVEKATELPMLALSLLLVPVLLIPVFVAVPARWELTWQTINWIIWAAFAAELVVKTYLAPHRLRYLRDHWFDVLIVAIPFLRPLRVIGALRLLRLLALVRAVSVGIKALTTARAIVLRNGLPYALLVAVVLILAATLAVAYFERDAGGTITNLGTALWWAVTTATTVGYGDTTPVTPEGRGIAVFVMIVGITLFSLLTANATAFFVHSRDNRERVTLDDIAAHIRHLEQQVSDLRAEVAGRSNVTGANAALRQPDGPPRIETANSSGENVSARKH